MKESGSNIKINVMKMKILFCSRKNNIRTRINLKGDKVIEQVGDFRYLKSTICSDGRCKKEIMRI